MPVMQGFDIFVVSLNNIFNKKLKCSQYYNALVLMWHHSNDFPQSLNVNSSN